MTSDFSPRRQRKVVITTSPAPSESDSRRDSYFSEVSQSTAPTSYHSASGSNNKTLDVSQGNKPMTGMKASTPAERRFDMTSSSIATYDSVLSEMAPLCRDLPVGGDDVEVETEDEAGEEEEQESGDDDDDDDREDDQEDADKDFILSDPESLHIPPVLPPYRGTSNERPCRPSTPQDFSRLFPSLDRLVVRHDDCTSDGNMNLRVDTVVPFGHSRRTLAVQLFHLRMHDLVRREFSLRRYCRDSGREVCNSKRTYAPAPNGTVAAARPAIQRSMSSAMRTMTTPFHRPTSSTSSIFKHGNATSASDNASVWSGSHHTDKSESQTPKPKARMVPTNRIKLEFSNYARVDIARRGGRTNKRYEFEWWGHAYAWKRVIDKNLNVVSFHLVRDGHGTPVAHIVPEMRSPNQVLDDEMAGAWVTPCYIWISDNSIIDAITDVADVIISTGLISLVDDCIKERWQAKKPSHRAIRRDNADVNQSNPRSFMPSFFQRRHSEEHSSSRGSMRFGRKPVAAY
ncbi:uncharacterized protein FTOL_11643 [Fusarium torulosum]|uniref:Uncharacterized protein n=1 Tax=Fusarium torulosum TaxID=33205 RepID=A0AAE8MIN8_9HYPO|nr:uncharacterized protein FTOL_11643 [Fusarium torulosum]